MQWNCKAKQTFCSCGAVSQWKLSKATPTKSTHCHFNFHTYHITGSALLHIGAVTYTVLLYLSYCEIWSNCDQIPRFVQIFSFLEAWRFCKILECLQSGKKLFAHEFHLFVKMGFRLSSWVGIWAIAHSCTRFPCYLGMQSMQRPNGQQQRLSSWAIS